MPLGDIHKKLYNPNSNIENRDLPEDPFDPKRKFKEDAPAQPPQKPPLKSTQDEFWLVEHDRSTEEKKDNSKKWLKFSLMGLAAIIVLVLAFLGIVKYRESAFTEERIDLKIEGPTELQSGKTASYKITLTNNNRVDLNDAVLHLNYSPDITLEEAGFLAKEGFNSSKVDLGLLKAHESKTYEIKAKAFGPRDKQIYFNAELAYQPENFHSQFQKKTQLSAIIKSSALNLSLSGTREAASGEAVELQVILKNQGSEAFSDLAIQMEYPEGFIFKNATPEASSENKTWKLASVKAGEQVKIIIKGTLDAPANATRLFKVYVGKDQAEGNFLKYDESQTTVSVIGQRVDISQTINGKTSYFAYAGDVLEMSIKFKNNSQIPLRDLILTEKISSPVLDKTQIIVNNGHYDSATEQIVWKASDVPALKTLEPNQEGEVRFRLKVADNFPMQSDKDKNFVITSQAVIDSQDIDSAIGENKRVATKNMEVKVNSKLILDVVGNYNDGEIPNTGPIPPKVGQETTYTLRFQLRNTSNNLKNVVLSTSLPTGVKWTNKVEPDITGVEYNERSNELKWLLGTVEAGTGFILPSKSLAFQLGMTPGPNQVSQNLILLNPIKVTATDSFTNQPVEYNFQSFGTVNLTDVGSNNWIVVP